MKPEDAESSETVYSPRPLSSGFVSTPGQPWTPPPPEVLQPCFPQYEIVGLLGRGGMGAVYKGWQKSLDRYVAIKVLPPSMDAEDASYTERFKQEARSMAKLNHPGIIAVYDAGETPQGLLYFVMEYVEGTDVHQMVSAAGRLPPEHAMAITAHVCEALAYAHEHGLIHRDIKPANIMVDHEGRVKVADFGLAKASTQDSGLTQTNMAMGTPDYVSPEALMAGMALDGRADLYAVGVMLYQMLTGKVPRGAFHPASLVVPGLDARWDQIIQKAMQMDREERHGSARELRQHLDSLLMPATPAPELKQYSTGVVQQVPAGGGKRSGPRSGPPPRRTASPPPPRATAKPAPAPEPVAKGSPLAWIIPAAVSAVVIIGGALYMRGQAGDGTKPEAPAPQIADRTPSSPKAGSPGPRPEPPPPRNNPAPGGERNGQPPRPTASTPPPSPSGATNDSRQTFPPARWVRLYNRTEDLPPDLRQPSSGVRFDKGWVKFSKPQRLFLPAGLTKNYAVRVRVERERDKSNTLLILRETPNTGKHYRMSATGRGQVGELTVDWQDKNQSGRVFAVAAPWRLDFGNELLLEFGVVGDTLVGRMNGILVKTATDSRMPEGRGFITGAEGLKDIEVINLDGLPRAEALRLLGVDEKGNNIRPASHMQGEFRIYPPGQWTPTYTHEAEFLQSKQPGSRATWENGRTVMFGEGMLRCTYMPMVQDQGVRFKLNSQAGMNFGQIRLRDNSRNPGYFYSLTGSLPHHLAFQIESRNANSPLEVKGLQRADVKDLWKEGENAVEVYAIGKRLYARLNGRLVLSQDIEEASSGAMGFNRIVGSIHAVQLINLEGIPEAEALNVVGVDAQGNDLRTARLAEETKAQETKREDAAIAAIPELASLHSQFITLRGQRVDKPFEDDLAKLNISYVGGMDREVANEKAAGHLDGVLALEAEKKSILAGQPVPEDDSRSTESLKRLRAIYREAYGKLEAQRVAQLKLLTDPLTNRLKQMEADLTKQDRIADAQSVRDYREKLAQAPESPQVAATPAATPPATGSSATASLPPVKSYPKGDDRKAAEWALRLGGTIRIQTGDSARIVRKVEELPESKFQVLEIYLRLGPMDAQKNAYEDLSALAGLQNLTRLETTFLPMKDEHLAVLPSVPSLTALNISNTELTDAVCQYMGQIKSLERLSLFQCPKFTGASLDRLVGTNLKVLIFNNMLLTEATLTGLARLKGLNELQFTNVPISDAIVPIVKELAELKNLKFMKSVGYTDMKLTVAGLEPLKALKNLNALGWNFTPGQVEADVKKLSSWFPKIRYLEVPGASFSKEDITAFSGFRSLVVLQLTGPAINDESIQGILNLENLDTVLLRNGVTITDRGVTDLCQHRKLTNVIITEAQSVSDVSLQSLAKMRVLKRLEVQNCSLLTAAGMAAFKKERPEVSVTSPF